MTFVISLLAAVGVMAQGTLDRGANGNALQSPPSVGGLEFQATPRLILLPGEAIYLRTTALHADGKRLVADQHPELDWLEIGPAFDSNWHASAGTIEDAGPDFMVFRAPAEQGNFLVIWSDGSSMPVVLEVVVPGGTEYWEEEESLPVVEWAGQAGNLIPSAGGGGFALFAPIAPGASPENHANGRGFSVVPTGKPLNPRPPPSNCVGPQRETRTKSFTMPHESSFVGTLKVTADLQAKLLARGTELSVGATIRITRETDRTHFIKITDCYACQSGQLVYTGSTVTDYWITTVRFEPPWAEVLFGQSGERRSRPHTVTYGSC